MRDNLLFRLICNTKYDTILLHSRFIQMEAEPLFMSKSCFSDFVPKIRLIRLEFSFQKNPKIPVFELSIYWFPVRSQNHYTKEPTGTVRDRKASVTFSRAWLILVELT